MVRRLIASWTFGWVALLAVAIWWAASVLPTSRWWFEATTMLIPDTPSGEPIIMVVDREIKRPVYGSWTVTVREQGEGGWALQCVASGSGDYHPNAILPDPLTLDWWTDGQCDTLGPGTYFVTTTWAFRPRGVPGYRRSPPLVSNAFRVLEVE